MIITNIKSIPKLRPVLPMGCFFDIPTGKFHKTSRGNKALNGGLKPIIGICGPANSFKSAIAIYMNTSITDRYRSSNVMFYDSESTLNYDRINQLCSNLPNLGLIDHGDDSIPPGDVKVTVTSNCEMFGDEHFQSLKKEVNKTMHTIPYITTPFISGSGVPIKMKNPTMVVYDSLTELSIRSQYEKIIDKSNIGDKETKILYMNLGAAKKQLITQLPLLSSNGGLFFTLTAHIGREFDMGMYTPKAPRLAHSKRGVETKGVGDSFKFICNTIYEINYTSTMYGSDKKTGVLYPKYESDRSIDTVDLVLISMKVTKNKGGLTGQVINIIVSQRDGVQAHLSQFHHLKEHSYGLSSGTSRTYELNLLPGVKFTRFTVRKEIEESYALRRAIEIESDMLQMKQQWTHMSPEYLCTPEELYNDIIKLGYDWDVLLDTVGYWIPDEELAFNKPELSTMDLLDMRAGTYKPYWMKDN